MDRRPTRSNRTLRAVLIATMLGALAASTGCYFEGGPGYSADRFAYVSRTWTPKTVTLIDTRTGEALWSMDVPVGQRLVIDFKTPQPMEKPDPWLPDTMLWDIMPERQRFGELKNKIRVPPSSARRVDMSLRPTPEYPPDADKADPTYKEATEPTPPERIIDEPR